MGNRGGGYTHLDEFGLDLEDLVPAGGPEVVTAQDPVLAPLWEVGVEPGGDGHQVWLACQASLPRLVGCGILVGVACWPRIPGETTVGRGARHARWAKIGPIRHKEAAGFLFDCRPVAYAIAAFKGRDEGFAVVFVLRTAGCGGEGIDCVCGYASVPLAVGSVVEGKEEAKVAVVLGRLGCKVDGGGSVTVAGSNIQRKRVDPDICGFGDVVEPVCVFTASSISNLQPC